MRFLIFLKYILFGALAMIAVVSFAIYDAIKA